jgi:predicted transposase YdaD
MPDDCLHHPNDKLFKQGFKDPETAAGFLKAYLPQPIAAAVDWPQLALQPGSFVDSQFRAHESDLLFSAPLCGREALFYFLIEHQTNEDPAIALRLLRYMVRIWEERLTSEPQKLLPVILPVVLAQNDRAWRIKPEFSAMFDVPEEFAEALRPFVPDFLFRLIQLAEIPFDGICGTPAGIMVMRVMKAERCNQLLADPVWDEEILRHVPQTIFEMLLRFMMNADVDIASVERRVFSIQTEELKHTAMTYAQKLHQEGHQEGRQEGRQEGQILAQQRAILDALEIRFERVPAGLSEEISQITESQRLQSLLRAAIQATTLEAFSTAL